MRKDAERNRDRLIAAASEMMRREGGDQPMEVIAERAGVTRGTLYRNFPHRQAMYEAVLASDLAGLEAALAADAGADPLAFVRRMAGLMMVYDRFLMRLAAMPDYDAAAAQARMVGVVAAPLAAAQARGLLDGRLTGDDVLVACRMLASHWRLDAAPDAARAFEARLDLMMRGLGPAPAGGDGARSDGAGGAGRS